jgi:Bifunctional DNA primase/polymerase, N-terminal
MTATIAPATTLLTAALRYAQAGYAIFPIVPGDKVPLKGVHWREDATTDEATIRQWWEATPDANIGLPTGSVNNLFVVDVDGDEGRATLHALEFTNGKLPYTHLVTTPSGGYHRYFRWQPGLGTGAGKIGRKVDHRGEGGYVVASPSRRPEGNYRGHFLGNAALAEPPAWLVNLLKPPEQIAPKPVEPPGRTPRLLNLGAVPRPATTPPDELDPRRVKAAQTCIQRASELQEGERNHGTFKWAAALRKAVVTEDQWENYREQFLDALPYGPSNGGKPFTRSEAEGAVRSAEARQSLGEWEPDSGPFGEAEPKPKRARRKRPDAAYNERRIREAILSLAKPNGWTGVGEHELARQAKPEMPPRTARDVLRRLERDGQVERDRRIGKPGNRHGFKVIWEHPAWSEHKPTQSLALSEPSSQVRAQNHTTLVTDKWAASKEAAMQSDSALVEPRPPVP